MLKAAQIATTEPGPDAEKRIHQRHFIQGMEEVLAGESVMSQSLFDVPAAAGQAGGVLEQMAEGQEQLRGELGLVAERLEQMKRSQERLEGAVAAAEQRPKPSSVPLYMSVAALILATGAVLLALL